MTDHIEKRKERVVPTWTGSPENVPEAGKEPVQAWTGMPGKAPGSTNTPQEFNADVAFRNVMGGGSENFDVDEAFRNAEQGKLSEGRNNSTSNPKVVDEDLEEKQKKEDMVMPEAPVENRIQERGGNATPDSTGETVDEEVGGSNNGGENQGPDQNEGDDNGNDDNPDAQPQPTPEQIARQQAQDDWANAIGMNTANGIAGIGGGIVQGANKVMGMLVGLTRGVLSGDALGFGADVGNAVMEGGMALKPVKDSIGRALGINEKNGTIDPEAAGTLRGTQYYVQQRKVKEFHENTNKWLQEVLGPDANEGNVMQMLNNMTPEQAVEFADKFNAKVDAEKQRLYDKAAKGELDAVDKALLDTYTSIGDKVRQSTYLNARKLHLEGAQMNSQAQQMRLENAIREQEFKDRIAGIKDAIHASGDKRQIALFDIMERNIMTNRHDQYKYPDLIYQDKETGQYKVNEEALDMRDWKRLANSLDSQVSDPDNADPELMNFLKEIHRKSYDVNAFKAKERQRSARYREGVDDPGNSLIDRKQAEARAKGHYDGVDGVNAFSIPRNTTTRNNWADECDQDISKIELATGMSIYDLLEEGKPEGNPDDPDYQKALMTYQKALMAYHNRIALGFTDTHDNLVRKLQLDNSEEAQNDIRALKSAYVRAMMGEYDDDGNVIWPGYVLRKDDLDGGQFFSGVVPGSPQADYISIYNNIVGKHNEGMMDPKDPKDRGPGFWEYIDDGSGWYDGGIPQEKIFGKNIGGGPTENVDAILSDGDETVHIQESARIDAEGLTREELYPILKAKMGMEQDQADDFIDENMDNVGVIDTKDDLNNAMAEAYSFRNDPQGASKQGWGDIKPQMPKGYKTPDFSPPKPPKNDIDPYTQRQNEFYGGTKNEKNKMRKLTTEYKNLMEEVYSTGEFNPTLAQQDRMDFIRREYKALTGKELDSPGTTRGRTPEQIEARKRFNGDLQAIKDEQEMRDNVNAELGALFGHVDWSRKEYDRKARAMEALLTKRVNLDPSMSEEAYGRNRAKLISIMDSNPNDKELRDGLNDIWNAYISDYLRNKYLTDGDSKIFRDLVSHKKNYPLTNEERDQLLDVIRGRITRGGWDINNINSGGYLGQVRGEMEGYVNEHRDRIRADRDLNDFFGKLAGSTLKGNTLFDTESLLNMTQSERGKALNTLFKEYEKEDLRRLKKELAELKAATLDNAVYNKDFYGDKNEPRFQESYKRYEDALRLYNDVNSALIRTMNSKTAGVKSPVREVTDPRPREFNRLSNYAWVVSNFGLGTGDLGDEVARGYVEKNVFPYIRAVLKGELVRSDYPGFGNLKLRNYYAYFTELKNRLEGYDSKTEGFEKYRPLEIHRDVIDYLWRCLDEEVNRRGGIEELNRMINNRAA